MIGTKTQCLALVGVLACVPPDAPCEMPDLTEVALRGDVTETVPETDVAMGRVMFVEETTEGAPRTVALTWPTAGAVAILQCDGTINDLLLTGSMDSAWSLPWVAVNGVVVRSYTGRGSGWIRKDFGVVVTGNSGLKLQWSGVASEKSVQAPEVGLYELEGRLQWSDEELIHIVNRYPLVIDPVSGGWIRGGREQTDTNRVARSAIGGS